MHGLVTYNLDDLLYLKIQAIHSRVNHCNFMKSKHNASKEICALLD